MKQLTVGNIITVGVNLYRSNFKNYLWLSLIAHLWLLIPLYGWGKYLETASDMSYLSFKQLLETRQRDFFNKVTSPFLWLRYLLTFVLITITCIIFSLIILILFIIIITFLIVGLTALFNLQSTNISTYPSLGIGFLLLYIVIIVTFYLCFLFSLMYPYSRLFLTDLILITNKNNKVFQPLTRSYQLTKCLNFKMLTIFLLCFGITVPLINISFITLGILAGIIIGILQGLLTTEFDPGVTGTTYLVLWSFFINIVTLPFWQSVKAAAYYKALREIEAFDLRLI